jgi:sugar lactone lactonase YvrE
MTHSFVRCGRARAALARGSSAAALIVACTLAAQAADKEVSLPGARLFPESITVAKDGSVYVGSFTEGGVLRATPGATEAEPWIKGGANGTRSTFGLLADDASNTLWVCSNNISGWGIEGPGAAPQSVLASFDLKTGADKMNVPLPTAKSFCNDIAIGADGSAFVGDTSGTQILRLAPGTTTFEVWADDPRFAPPANGGGLDGLAFGSDGHLYINTFTLGGLWRVEVKDGKAGTITELKTSRPLKNPDGLRLHGPNQFLMAEGGGTIDLVTIQGDTAKIDTLRDGLTGGPVSVAEHESTVWYVEGQLGYVFNPALKGKDPAPFKAVGMPMK